MARFVLVPVERLPAATLESLLEEYASRDGTDYGAVERSLGSKVSALFRQLHDGSLNLVYDLDSERYDLLDRERADGLLPGARR